MPPTSKINHPPEAFLYATSRLLERASYYGFRGIIVLYMITGPLQIDQIKALSLYGWVAVFLLIAQVAGALLGDLALGNKKAVLLGGLFQALGAFSCCLASTTGLYAGLCLLIVGNGLYTPNTIANFGKLYLKKTTLLDAGFTGFYLAINLGSFIGVLLVGTVGENYGWNRGFVLAGILMLLSIVPILFSSSDVVPSTPKEKITFNQRSINIGWAFLFVGVFWAVFEMNSLRIFDLQALLSAYATTPLAVYIWKSFGQLALFPISIIAVIVWTFFYSTQLFKLMIGFVLAVLSYGFFLLLPEIPEAQHTFTYIVAMLLLSLAEIHIAPVVYSILTQYSAPKYLAIIVSLSFIPVKLCSLAVGLFEKDITEQPIVALWIGMFILIMLSLGLVVYHFIYKKQPVPEHEEQL